MEEIQISTETIQLNQALKLAGVLQTGGEIARLIEAGAIRLNGKPVSEKRKQLHDGDILLVGDDAYYRICRK